MAAATPSERVTWSEEHTGKFLDICIELKATPMSKINWEKIVINLNVQTGKQYTEKQCRNHYNDLRKKYKVWEEMELKWTGLAFDPITGCPEVEQDDRWNSFVKKHKGVPTRFLKKPLPHLTKLRALYSGSFATSKWSFSPTLDTSLFTNGAVSVEENSDGGGKDDEDADLEVTMNKSEFSTVVKRKSDECASKAKKQMKSDIDSCLEILKMSLQVGTMEAHSNKYEKISAILNNIQEVAEQGEAFVFQCMQFLRQSDNGDYFLGLASNAQRLMFLKTSITFSLDGDCYIPQMTHNLHDLLH